MDVMCVEIVCVEVTCVKVVCVKLVYEESDMATQIVS